MKVDFTDNSREVLDIFEAAALRALEKCGLVAEGYAKKLQVPDTGLLRNSITYAIGGEAAAIETYEADRPKPGRKSSGCTGCCGLHPHSPPQTDGSVLIFPGVQAFIIPKGPRRWRGPLTG